MHSYRIRLSFNSAVPITVESVLKTFNCLMVGWIDVIVGNDNIICYCCFHSACVIVRSGQKDFS